MTDKQYFVKRGEIISGPFTGAEVRDLASKKLILDDQEIGPAESGPWTKAGTALGITISLEHAPGLAESANASQDEASQEDADETQIPTPQAPRTTQCEDCGGLVSHRVASCPHCGAPSPTASSMSGLGTVSTPKSRRANLPRPVDSRVPESGQSKTITPAPLFTFADIGFGIGGGFTGYIASYYLQSTFIRTICPLSRYITNLPPLRALPQLFAKKEQAPGGLSQWESIGHSISQDIGHSMGEELFFKAFICTLVGCICGVVLSKLMGPTRQPSHPVDAPSHVNPTSNNLQTTQNRNTKTHPTDEPDDRPVLLIGMFLVVLVFTAIIAIAALNNSNN